MNIHLSAMTDALRDACYCTDEGPCESHLEVLCSREGASLHTADELRAIFIGDAIDMMDPDNAATAGYVTDEDRALFASVVDPIRETADEYWTATDNRGGWCDDADLTQALYDDAFLLETYLPFYVWWEDGYVVGRIIGGPLADEPTADVVKCVSDR